MPNCNGVLTADGGEREKGGLSPPLERLKQPSGVDNDCGPYPGTFSRTVAALVPPFRPKKISRGGRGGGHGFKKILAF